MHISGGNSYHTYAYLWSLPDLYIPFHGHHHSFGLLAFPIATRGGFLDLVASSYCVGGRIPYHHSLAKRCERVKGKAAGRGVTIAPKDMGAS